MYQITTLSTDEEIEAFAGLWDGLQARYGLVPFTGYAFAKAWWDVIGVPSGVRRLLAVASREGQIVGMIPFTIRANGRVRVLRLLGHEAFFYRAFLTESDACAAAIFSHVLAAKVYDVANLKNIAAETEVASKLASCGINHETSKIYHVPLEPRSREEILQSLARPFRRKITSALRHVEQNGDIEIGFQSGAPLADDLLLFMVSQKQVWVDQRGKRGLFKEGDPQAFYRAMCAASQEGSQPILSWIKESGRPVAAFLSFAEKGVLYGHTMTFDPAAARWTPGLLLTFETIVWASQQGMTELNFMEGEEDYKRRFTSHYRGAQEFLVARTLVGTSFLWTYRGLCLYRRIKAFFKSKA